jgi:hypothetical protein
MTINITNMLAAISYGNHVLNEQIKLYKNIKSDCPVCLYDPMRNESSDSNCQTCGGVGQIIVESFSQIDASVEQESDFSYDYTKAGKIVNGKIYVTIDIKEINEILNANSTYDLSDYHQMKKFIDQYDYITWSSAKYIVESFEPGLLQGSLYEIAVTLSLIE